MSRWMFGPIAERRHSWHEFRDSAERETPDQQPRLAYVDLGSAAWYSGALRRLWKLGHAIRSHPRHTRSGSRASDPAFLIRRYRRTSDPFILRMVRRGRHLLRPRGPRCPEASLRAPRAGP